MEGIFDLSSILWHVLNAAILFVALYFLLYKPVRKFMQKRADGVSAQLDEAAQKEKDADALLEQSHGALSSAQREAAETVSQSARQAQKRADEILSTANAKAEEIVSTANEQARRILQKAKDEAAAAQRQIDELQRQASVYRSNFRMLMQAQLQILEDSTIGRERDDRQTGEQTGPTKRRGVLYDEPLTNLRRQANQEDASSL